MLKNKDRQIIAYLRRNAKVKLTKVAQELEMPTSTVYEKVNNSQGIISRHVCLVDFKKLGYLARVILALKAGRNDKEKLRDYLVQDKNVNTLSKINNGFDLMAEIVFEDMRKVEDFKDKIKLLFQIEEMREYYILHDLKKETFLS
jgi:DNA-binding Lrp family transcriptional regulator